MRSGQRRVQAFTFRRVLGFAFRRVWGFAFRRVWEFIFSVQGLASRLLCNLRKRPTATCKRDLLKLAKETYCNRDILKLATEVRRAVATRSCKKRSNDAEESYLHTKKTCLHTKETYLHQRDSLTSLPNETSARGGQGDGELCEI